MLDGFVSWAARAAIRLPRPLACTPELETFLSRELAGVRILALGEADHWIHEKVECRLAFARAAGFTHFGEELSFSDGLRIDDWLAGRPGASLDRVALFGCREDVRADRDDAPTGVLAAAWDRSPDRAFRREHERLLGALRELPGPAAAPRFFGFDVDALPGGAYADLRARGFEAAERVPGESLDQEIERLSARIEAGPPEDPVARRSLETLRDSLCWVRLAHPAPSYEALRPAMAFRERVMHRLVDQALDELPEGGGLTLWAHDLHLARDDRRIRGHRGAEPGGGEVPCLGTHLARRHGDALYVVWMVCGSGEDAQPFPDLPHRLRPPRRSLNGLLRRVARAVGGGFVLPTRRADGSGPKRLLDEHRFYHLYNGFVTLRPAEQADALCFIDDVTPLSQD